VADRGWMIEGGGAMMGEGRGWGSAEDWSRLGEGRGLGGAEDWGRAEVGGGARLGEGRCWGRDEVGGGGEVGDGPRLGEGRGLVERRPSVAPAAPQTEGVSKDTEHPFPASVVHCIIRNCVRLCVLHNRSMHAMWRMRWVGCKG
jgi:hypothetical protein